jgi:spoIIIJ-associated protein
MNENDPPRYVDVSGPTLQDAIEKGLSELGLTRNDVIIEIMDEGGGTLSGGSGSEAVVRLTPLRRPAPPPPTPPPAPPTPPARREEPAQPVAADEEYESDEFYDDYDDDVYEEEDEDDEDDYESFEDYDSFEDEEEYIGEDGGDDVSAAAREALGELLELMQVNADIYMRRAQAASADEEPPWVLDVRGRDLGVLIGRHGETLNALQFVTRLVCSRKLQRRANIVVDVEGYKSRRESTLRRMARQMAERATRQGRTITLDPMPPNERRIIHITLRDDQNVETESVGMGDQRRITIIPVRSGNR